MKNQETRQFQRIKNKIEGKRISIVLHPKYALGAATKPQNDLVALSFSLQSPSK